MVGPSVDELLAQFSAAFLADRSTRPSAWLDQANGPQRRAELAAAIDRFLEQAPRRPFDRAAFEASPAQVAAAGELEKALEGVTGTWPVLLPRLRHAARLRRMELVARLSEALGVGGREEQVAGYVHAMEQGLIEPDGVSDRVLEALGGLLGTTGEALRRAGAAMAPPSPAAGGAVFARAAAPSPEAFDEQPAVELGSSMGEAPPPSDRLAAEVDRLFTGGR